MVDLGLCWRVNLSETFLIAGLLDRVFNDAIGCQLCKPQARFALARLYLLPTIARPTTASLFTSISRRWKKSCVRQRGLTAKSIASAS